MSTSATTTIPVLEGAVRQRLGSRSVQVLRSEGQVPAIIYGHKQDNVSVALNGHTFEMTMRSKPTVLNVRHGGRDQYVIIKEIQYEPFGNVVRHVDFQRVNLDEMVAVAIPLEFMGTPKGSDKGGKLQVTRPVVHVRVRADAIPAVIVINISGIDLNEGVLCRDIKLPSGAELLDTPTWYVCRVVIPRRIKEPEKPAEAAAAAPVEGAEGAVPAEGAEGKPADGKAAAGADAKKPAEGGKKGGDAKKA